MSGPPRLPRICVLTSVHPPLDTRVFYRQARSTAAAGFPVLMIAPGAPSRPVDGVRFSSLPTIGGRAGRPLRWPILFAKALRSRADIYHFHDPELLPWGVLLHWVTRKPVIYDSHEYLREDIRGKQWVPARIRRPLAAIADGIEKWAGRRLSAVVVVTEEMGSRFEQAGAPRVVLVRNLPPAPNVPENSATEKLPVVAYAGLMNIERGLDILYDTARLVRQHVPDAEFHILGTIEWDGMPKSQQEMSEAEWAEVGVRFLGTVPPAQVHDIISRGRVGWLPRSPRFENNLLAWPNKLVEYMTAGLPIVASDLPLQASVVNENECGRVVSPIAPEAHASAIVALLQDPLIAERLGENGRQAARIKYTWEAEARRLHTLYKDLWDYPGAAIDP